LYAFGRRGIVGGPLYDATGFLLPFSGWGVVLANTFIAMPFMVLTVEGALRGLDPRPEAAARTLGAGRWTVIRRVTLPMLRPALVAGFVLSWARALGEFGATVTFAGNLQGSTQTMPLAVFVALESDRDAALAISLLLVVLSLAILVGLRDRWLRSW
jgi:molybdate transport system permease protein